MAFGILGGTFNPPHLGHVALAHAAREQLGLETVVLMPLHTPPHKPGGRDPGPLHRLAMCRLATEDEPGLDACELEVQRGGPSYTVDTLKDVHARQPEAELTFIVGADTARTLPGWREPREITRLARLAIAPRAGASREDVLESLAAVDAEAPEKAVFLELDELPMSSSLARLRLAGGEPVDDLLAPQVAAYIREHRLYGTAQIAAAGGGGR